MSTYGRLNDAPASSGCGTAAREIYVSAIHHVCGEPRRIADLASVDTAQRAALIEEIGCYRQSCSDIWELGTAAARGTLAAIDAQPDLLIYVSENDTQRSASLVKIVDCLGLRSIEWIALSGYDCGNLGAALQFAGDMLVAGRRERILLLLADRSLSGDRFMTSGLSVFSDGALACMVTREPVAQDHQFKIRSIAVQSAVPVRSAEADGILSTVRLATRSVEELLTTTASTREDFDYVIMANYRPTVQRFLLAAMKFPSTSLLLGPIDEFGHCFSADILMTLDRYLTNNVLGHGALVAAAALGPHSWSSLAIECIARTTNQEKP